MSEQNHSLFGPVFSWSGVVEEDLAISGKQGNDSQDASGPQMITEEELEPLSGSSAMPSEAVVVGNFTANANGSLEPQGITTTEDGVVSFGAGAKQPSEDEPQLVATSSTPGDEDLHDQTHQTLSTMSRWSTTRTDAVANSSEALIQTAAATTMEPTNSSNDILGSTPSLTDASHTLPSKMTLTDSHATASTASEGDDLQSSQGKSMSNTPPTSASNHEDKEDNQSNTDDANDEVSNAGSLGIDEYEAMVNDFKSAQRPSIRDAIIQGGYDLRPSNNNFDRENFAGTGYLDFDDTGTYDPAAEPKRAECKRKRETTQSHEPRSVPTPTRPHVTCCNCRSNKVKCSINSMESEIPCVNCKKEGSKCTFESVPRQKKQVQHPTEEIRYKAIKSDKYDLSLDHSDNWDDSNLHVHRRHKKTKKQTAIAERAKARNERSSSDSDSNAEPQFFVPLGGISKFIKTSFCHPIHFNYVPPDLRQFADDDTEKFQCHFCYGDTKASFYSLFGIDLEPKTVRVIDMQDGTGYVEVSDGWKALGKPETRMCQECVFMRMQMALCLGHEIRRIANLDMDGMDISEVLAKLITESLEIPDIEKSNGPYSDPRSLKQMNVRWCSICPYPAFWECCTRPEFDQNGETDPHTHDGGCGLNLCETCASRMLGCAPPKFSVQVRGKKVGVKAVSDLDSMLLFAEDDQGRYPDGLRADAGFLTSGGELITRANKLFGAGDGASAVDIQPEAPAPLGTRYKSNEFVDDDDMDLDGVEEIEEPRTANFKGKGKAAYLQGLELEIPVEIDSEEEMDWPRPAPKRYGTAGSSSQERVDLT